jgi:hypothetical protein
MKVHLFKSLGAWNVRALAVEPSGTGLPNAYAPWQPVPESEACDSERLSPTVTKALRCRGFFLMSGSVGVFDGRLRAPSRKRAKAPANLTE